MKKVLFKIGRGGRFNNPGHTSCEGLIDGFDAECFGIDVYFTFENISEVLENSGFESIDELEDAHGFNDTDFANDWDEEAKNNFNEMKIIDKVNSDEEDTIYITADDLGDAIVVDGANEQMCTVEEYNSDTGRFEYDGDYKTYFWKPFTELDGTEMDIAAPYLLRWEKSNLESLLINIYDDLSMVKLIIYLMEQVTYFDTLGDGVFFGNETFEEIVKEFCLKEYETEEEADEAGSYVDIYGKYYVL